MSPKVSVPKYQSKHAIFATDLSAHHEATLLHARIGIVKVRLVRCNQLGMEPGKTKKMISAREKKSDQHMHLGVLLYAQCVAYDPKLLQADSEDSGQTGPVFRLIKF